MSQPYTENYRLLSNAESRRHSLLQERVGQLVSQYQMGIPKNVHSSNIIQTEHYIYECVLNAVTSVYVFETKGNGFEADQEAYEGIWGLEKKNRRNIIIIL